MKLKKKVAPPAPAQKAQPKKTEEDITTSADYCERFKGELYGPLPEDVESIDLRTPSPYIVKVSRKIFPCRLVYQHNFLTLTLPFRGYHKNAYEKEVKKLFDMIAKLEKDLKVHFTGIVHADDDKPRIKYEIEKKAEIVLSDEPAPKKSKFKIKFAAKKK